MLDYLSARRWSMECARLTESDAQTLARAIVSELLDQLERRGILSSGRIAWDESAREPACADHTETEGDGEWRSLRELGKKELASIRAGKRPRKSSRESDPSSRGRSS